MSTARTPDKHGWYAVYETPPTEADGIYNGEVYGWIPEFAEFGPSIVRWDDKRMTHWQGYTCTKAIPLPPVCPLAYLGEEQKNIRHNMRVVIKRRFGSKQVAFMYQEAEAEQWRDWRAADLAKMRMEIAEELEKELLQVLDQLLP